jgi:hypothetical protein
LVLADAPTVQVEACAADARLVLTARLPGLAAVAPWALLCRNALLPPGVKFALGPGLALLLRAELFLESAVPLMERLPEVTKQWVQVMTAQPSSAAADAGPAAEAESAARAADLGRLAAAAQWPLNQRASGRMDVPLEVPGRALSARLTTAGNTLRVAAEFAGWPQLGSASRAALGLLLLSATQAVSLARAFARELPERAAVGAEVVFQGEPAVPELEAALSALSVFAGLCGEELRALADGAIAEEFLALRGVFPPEQNNNQRKDRHL